MERQLTREEEDRLVAEAEAVYESGGYDLSNMQEVRLIVGPNPGMMFEVSFRFSGAELDAVEAAADRRGVDIYEFLYRSARAAAGLPDEAPPRHVCSACSEDEDVAAPGRAHS